MPFHISETHLTTSNLIPLSSFITCSIYLNSSVVQIQTDKTSKYFTQYLLDHSYCKPHFTIATVLFHIMLGAQDENHILFSVHWVPKFEKIHTRIKSIEKKIVASISILLSSKSEIDFLAHICYLVIGTHKSGEPVYALNNFSLASIRNGESMSKSWVMALILECFHPGTHEQNNLSP